MRARIAAAVLLAVLCIPAYVPSADADGGADTVLIDMGNGITYWSDAQAGGTCADAARAAAEAAGLGFDAPGGTVTSIGNMSNHGVGPQQCSWRLYRWEGDAWRESSDGAYSGGAIAYGFYPDGSIAPAETPPSREAWTMHRGDSASSGISGSRGTMDPKSPMEWYRTYTTGYVDSSLIVAGDYLFHTTGGRYGAGGTDKNPWVYCLDRSTGDIVWSFMMAYGQGYEVTSPVVVGDMLVVTATNWNVYCFDIPASAAAGEGVLIDTLALPKDGFPYTADGDVAWRGRTFYTGATTPVYDSGALYFGTADGHVSAYTVTRGRGFELLWDYLPPASGEKEGYTGERGCFYFHAPLVTDAGGRRMVFMGSYEGYLYALDAATGREVYTERLIDLDGANKPHPGTPGSVAGITDMGDGRLLVSCTDGGLSPQTGYTVCIDAATGRGPGGSDRYWTIDAMVGGGVVAGGRFYSYVQPSANGAKELGFADGSSQAVRMAVYAFDGDGKVVWVSRDYAWIKAALTLADGVLYGNDYSAGIYYPSGGGVTALAAESGSELWRIKLSPYSRDSYSMVSATVLGGKVYVGNDYGAVYCISDVAGPQIGDSGEIQMEAGLRHWSWAALAAAAVVCLAFLKRFY